LYPDQVLIFGHRPRLGPGADDRRALGLAVYMMRRPHDQHDPSLDQFKIELVDLEGDLVLGVGDTGCQVPPGTVPITAAQLGLPTPLPRWQSSERRPHATEI
jgi:hypothetical protein